MAPIISVKVRTRGLSAGWNDRKEWLHITVRLGLESDGYVVLTVDDSVRLAAQDAHLAFDDLVNGRESSGHARFLKRLQNKTLLDDWPGEGSFLSQVTDSFSHIADAVLRMSLSAFGMPSNALANILDDPEPTPNIGSASLLQAISYSGCESLAAEAHIDRGLLTVVWEDTPGLQVCSPAGEWQPVTLDENQVAVFAGETLQQATAGRVPAAVHRVLLEPRTYANVVRSSDPVSHASNARVSLAFKQRPAAHAVIDLRRVPGFKPDSRYSHPIVVSDQMALFEANHPSIHQPSDGAHHQTAGQPRHSKRAKASRASGLLPQEMLRIFVRTLTAKIITLDLNQNATVQDMAEMIQEKDGLPPHQQRLIFGGQSITHWANRSLADLNIQAGSTVHLVLRICGD